MRSRWIFAVPLALSAAVVTTTYESSQENFPNPERGFYVQRSYNSARKEKGGGPLRRDDLDTARQRGMTLVRMIYTIEEFREKPLSVEWLDHMRADFALAREAGFKLIPRFAYNHGPVGAPDAPVERMLEHLEQLKPHLRANADVIAFVEAGFVGAWGEWHASTNGMFDDIPGVWWKALNGRTRALMAKWMEVLPADRMVTLRYPRAKFELYGQEPVTRSDAFGGSPKARTGAHNDCFLASRNDAGTYTDRMAEEREFYHHDNLFVPQGGETCRVGPAAQPYIGCANALKELAYFRYTTLNIDYHRGVLQGWEQGGCMPEIQRRMGYRFRLVESRIPETATAGRGLALSFTIVNDGWANLYNPRPVEIVLRHRATGKSLRTGLKTDPRFWMPGEPAAVDASITIPADTPAGEYEVLLHLPDAAPALGERSEFSIRLANKDVWETATGMNSLRRTVRCEPSSAPRPKPRAGASRR